MTENLQLEPFFVAPATVPGLGRFWALFERLDAGTVSHARYAGLLPAQEGETAEALTIRAAEYLRRQER